MKKNPIFYGLFLVVMMTLSLQATESSLERAETAYRQGELSESLQQREHYFNEALALYGHLANVVPLSGRLQYNVGNCYYQLGEYPRAFLHYRRAVKERPRDPKIWTALKLTKEQLGLTSSHNQFSLPSSRERWTGFSMITAIGILLCSVWIWTRNRFAYLGTLVATVSAALFLILSFYLHFLAPVEAVMLRAAPLYLDAGEHYARVQEKPIRAGEVVNVIAINEEGSWLKVRDQRGVVGYVVAERLELM